MTPFLLALWSSAPAWALCDLDGDGFNGVYLPACLPPRPDCDDGDSSVHPAASEWMSDLVDNDCDDLTDRIRRPFFVGFWGPASPEWTYAGGTTGNFDTVQFPRGAPSGSTAPSPGIGGSRTSA